MDGKRPHVEHVLCPTDFSEPSARALGYASAVAAWFGARITVAHVAPIVVGVAGDLVYFPTPRGITSEQRASLLEELRAFAAAHVEAGTPFDVDLVEGDPAREIERLTDRLKIDLLVLGTHGRRGAERWLLGSVAEQLVRRVRCPVLAVRAPRSPSKEGSLFKTIVCGADLRESSADTLSYALALAQDNDARLILLHALEGLPEPGTSPTGPLAGLTSAAAEAVREDALSRLRRAVPAEARTWSRVEERVVPGRAYKEILRAASEEGADLVVLGVHSHGVVERFFFGSTANHVLRAAPCPVLVVRSKPKDHSALETSRVERVARAVPT